MSQPDPLNNPHIVYIANMAEDVWDYIQFVPPHRKSQDIYECNLSSDRELSAFLNPQPTLLILPEPVDPSFITHINTLCPNTHRQIMVPQTNSGQISLDCIKDQTIITKLQHLSSTHHLQIVSYTSSPQFAQLINHLKLIGLNISTPESPNPVDLWTVNYFGSKSGFRDFYQKNQHLNSHLRMVKGQVFPKLTDCLEYAHDLYISGEGVVLKIPKGHSGIGVAIFNKHSLPYTKEHFITALTTKLENEPYWHNFPIIVEEFKAPNLDIGGGNPNAEMYIDDQGESHLLFQCGMRVQNGQFFGIEIGHDALPTAIQSTLENLGLFLGSQYAQAGYRGYFDVDCITDQNGSLYITESNVRRTGGTHVYHLAKSLLGDNFANNYYVLSNNYFALPVKMWTFETMSQLLKPILFDHQTKTGLIIAGANTLKTNYLTYVIIGNSKSHSLEIESQMIKLIG